MPAEHTETEIREEATASREMWVFPEATGTTEEFYARQRLGSLLFQKISSDRKVEGGPAREDQRLGGC